jgi:predicted O-methyltransferase YrrM
VKLRDAMAWREFRRVQGAGVVAGAIAGVLGAVLAQPLGGGRMLAAALLAFLLVWTPAALAGMLLHRVSDGQRQLQARVALVPLMGDLPVPTGDAALSPAYGEWLMNHLQRERPRLVLECGSGSSTVLIAECLRRLGGGRIVSLDHDEGYAGQTRRMLRERGLEGVAQVVHAPLVEREIEGERTRWYDFDPATLGEPVDFLFVDGPPAYSGPEARAPALPLLRPHLSPRAVVLLDDGNRAEERRLAERWAERAGWELERLPWGQGAWVVRAPAGRS